MMQFTPEQRAALDLHVHCAVHANAGSGKTSVVTHRFVRILVETGTPLDQIIAITFTRAAAAEMRERVHRLLTEAQHDAEIRASFASPLSDAELCRQLRQWSSAISTARISTFHSFCAGLVRQYAEELQLDADLRELEGTEATTLVDDAVRRAITEHLATGSPTATSLTTAFDAVSIDIVRSVLSYATRDTSFAQMLAMSADASAYERRQTFVNAHLRVIARDALDLFSAALAPLHDVPNIGQLLDRVRALAVRCGDPSDTAVTRDVHGLYGETFTTKHELRVSLLPKDVRAQLERVPTAPSELRSMVGMLATPWDAIQEQRFDATLRTIHDVAITARDHYRRAKRDRNAIDFDDMIHLTLALLNDTSVVEALRKSVRFVMVDEFQDTDPLQYEVLSRIAPALRGEDAPTPNVCIVGDDKQSIYGFRDADVRLFRRATYALQCANLHRGSDSGYRPLVTSFRMHERVAASVNAICAAMFGAVTPPPITDTTSYDVGYQPLRSITTDVQSDNVGTTTVLATRTNEFDAIANLVGNVLNGKLPREIAERDRATGAWSTRAPRPSDIAVLVQTNPQVVSVGEALAKLKIPVDLHGGASFFARPEIADIRALLTACIAPSDNLAVATLCRSPLLRCTDADLATAGLLGRRTSMRDGITQCVGDGSASPSLQRAHTLLSDWEASSLRMTPTDLIQHALDTSGWYATLELEDRRDQILANVDKAMEMIRSAVDGTGGTLYDAVAALNPLNGDRERDGFVPSDGDAVRVMTIHASKGLEFGIVVLAGLATTSRTPQYVSYDPLGVTFSVSTDEINPEAPQQITELPALASHRMAKLLTSQRELAEYRRRLYVALTRAKFHLVILHADDEIHGDLSGMGGVMGRALQEARQAFTTVSDLTSEPYHRVQIERSQLVLLDPLPTPLPELVAPTQFVHAQRWTEDDNRTREGDGAGAAYGIAVHEVLATILPAALDASESDRLSMIARSLSVHQLDRARATEAALEITSVLDAPIVREHVDVLRSARREVRLVGALDDVVLQGILDCRCSHADGSISVWDWKTNAVRNEADLDELARLYHKQMQTYAWLCFRAYPDCSRVTTRLVFTKAIARGLTSCDRSAVWERADIDQLESDLRLALAELNASSNS